MHIRCPHCHNPIEVVDADPLTDLTCPSCGSNFSLISGETASYTPGDVRTIGHFELLESVGTGRFGTVWKARDTKLDRTVAVKIPRRGQIEGPEAELFIREARAAAQVKHPGVVGVHEVGRDDGTLYIVSDFIDGCNLKEWLSGRQLTAREAAELCAKITEALHVAHEAGVVHRDLKPGNVMMDLAGRPHLTDFGLAKREAGEITMTVDGQMLGTPAYMSPEQARGEAHTADRRSDIWSLGVILFELLTSELPFRGNQRMMVVQILQDDPPSPRKLQTRIPRDLETICLKCLEKPPGNRYQTAAELAAEFGRFLRGESIVARPIGRAERFWRWYKRINKWRALKFILVFMLANIALGGIYGYLAVRREAINFQHDFAQQAEAIKPLVERVLAQAWARGGQRGMRESLQTFFGGQSQPMRVRWVWFDADEEDYRPVASANLLTAAALQEHRALETEAPDGTALVVSYWPMPLNPDRQGGLEFSYPLTEMKFKQKETIWRTVRLVGGMLLINGLLIVILVFYLVGDATSHSNLSSNNERLSLFDRVKPACEDGQT